MSVATARETILVVDDEPQVLVALEDLLSDDFVVLKSESGERALELVEQEPRIAVVVSDQRMPKMQGDQLFRRIRSRSGAERILATGYADLTAVIRAVNEGQIFAYVSKPWDPEDLRVKVQRAADHFKLARELARERQLLEDLMSNLPDAIFFKDQSLRYQKINDALLPIFGLKNQSDVVGRKLSELFPHNELVKGLEAEERALLSDGTPVRDSSSNFSIDGERRYFSTTKAPIRNGQGEAVGLVGVSRDVTSRVRMEEALRRREEQLELTFQASSAGLFDWDIALDTVAFSPSMQELMTGVAPEAGFRAHFRAGVHPDDIARVEAAVQQHLLKRTPLRALELRYKRDTEYAWLEVSGQAVWDAQGNPTRLVGYTTDISQRKQQEARIERLTRTYALLSGINATILRLHERGALFAEVCTIAVRVGGLALAVAVSPSGPPERRVLAWEGASRSLVDSVGAWLISNSALPGSMVEQAASARRPVVVDDLREANAATEIAPLLLAAGHHSLAVLPVIVWGQVNCFMALFADQAGFFDEAQQKLLAELADNIGFALEHSAQAERLNFLAYHDDLTGLPNRRLLTDLLSQQLTVRSDLPPNVAVVLFDIERFQHVNETLGRRAGDELLIEIGRRLRVTADGKHPVARYANNTFAAILGSLESEAEVAQWVERALSVLGQSFMLGSTELRPSARVGISLFPSDGSDADALFASAEAALKNAKVGARRYMFYTSAMNGRVAERLTLETKLRNAIEQEEFLLHYQPKLDLRSGRIIGLEALIRWSGPDGKLIAPGLFIPLLEETGMIVEVGDWVMRRAAAQHAEWLARGLEPPRIAVNVSPLQLGQVDFTQRLEAILRSYPSASAGLDLEITESVLMEDLTGNTDKLRQAKAAGLSVAIDDFGTGYSSLGYLSRLPIDALKIDRSFVMRMTDDPQEMAIVTTIISLAHALDLKVIAEGVETAQQAQLLRLLKCDQIQGYLVARPQAADAVETSLKQTFDFSKRVPS